MIEATLKVAVIAVLLLIFWQDTKDRLVTWFLYPLTGVLAYAINAQNVGIVPALANASVSLIIIVLVIAISYFYAVAVAKKKFLNESIGSGDLLFFACLPFTFATVSFIVLFVFALVFSLVLHFFLGRMQADATVPLAGYIAFFFAVVYLISFFTEPKYLFSL